jgi:protein required for attachment to host cells
MSTWILVANAAEARLYSTDKIGEAMECVREFEHPAGRAKGIDLVSDRPTQGKGAGHGPLGEASEAKAIELEHFAAELAKALEEGRNVNAYRHLVLVAAPHFHGLISKHLTGHTRALVSHNIEKDYSTYSERDLAARLKEVARG